jgi:hypothetical protein
MPAQAGTVVLGSSNIAPVLTDWLDNQEGNTWLTLDNRLPVDIAASPAWAKGSPDLGAGLVLPALHRSTVPVDPEKGVQLAVLDTQQITSPSSYVQLAGASLFAPPLNPPPGGPTQRWVKRRCPYLLHSNGGAPLAELYPPATWQPSVTLLLFGPGGGGGVAIYWVGQAADVPNGLASSQQLAWVPPDTCIMAATFTLLPGSTVLGSGPAGSGFCAGAIGDPETSPPGTGVNTLAGQQLIFGPQDFVGATVTIPMQGARAVGVGLSFNTGATEVYNVAMTAWLGVPPA